MEVIRSLCILTRLRIPQGVLLLLVLHTSLLAVVIFSLERALHPFLDEVAVEKEEYAINTRARIVVKSSRIRKGTDTFMDVQPRHLYPADHRRMQWESFPVLQLACALHSC